MTDSVQRTVARGAIGLALSAMCAGCFGIGAISTIAPMVAAGGAQMVGAQVAMRESGGTGVPKDEQQDRCDQLLRVPPGVEEVRKTKDGVIESRQWKIAASAGNPAWMMSREKSAPQNSWLPKPGVTKLNFNPPLYEMLAPDEPRFMAYAPASVETPMDSELFDSMTAAFGTGVGTFQWRGRQYTFVLVKELPCFKPAE